MGTGTGVSGIVLNFAVSNTYSRVEIYIDRWDKSENKRISDKVITCKDDIEDRFNGEIIWERLDDKRACRIKTETTGNIQNEDQWDQMIDYMTDTMIQFEKVFREPIRDAG